MPFEHESNIPAVYDRAPSKPDHSEVLFREDTFAQAADVNEAFSLSRRRENRVSDLVVRDGDRVDQADIIPITVTPGNFQMDAGKVYVKGDVRDVTAKLLTGVPMVGEALIGVRLLTEYVTDVDDADLLGIHPGAESEGEPGAARAKQTVEWGYEGDGGVGDLFVVYTLQDGVPIDQARPPDLSGFNEALALYDDDANGDYIVRGCRVTALGLISGDQHFDIEAGTANIDGYKRTRFAALRHTQVEEPDLDTVDAETHTFSTPGPTVVTVNRPPIDTVNSVVILKEKTAQITKGVTDSIDNLPDTSIQSIELVEQGATTYTETTDYVLNADRVDWTPGGIEPAQGTTYDVTYRYLDAVTPDSSDETTITISGGVDGGTIIINYDYKMPRIDLLCLDRNGNSAYVKGVSDPLQAFPPPTPRNLTKLAEIDNNWVSALRPVITNNGVRAFPFTEIDRMYRRLIDVLDLVALERLRRDIDSREPVAKKGVFVDPCENDRYRDAGEPQTLALFQGSMQLAIDPTFFVPVMTAPIMLDYTDQIVVQQLLSTVCHMINPYQNFDPLPGEMILSPTSDFWTEFQTDWLSDQTREISGTTNRTTVVEQLVDQSSELIENLRQINVQFTLKGFGNGEGITSVTFDGIDVTPGGSPAADVNGEFTGNFTIPANVPAGEKAVEAVGAGGSEAGALFVGQGILNTETLQRVITITRAPPRRVVVPRTRGRGEGGGAGGGGGDPLAQTFTLIEPRHVTGVDIKFCAAGDLTNGVVVELVLVRDGIPTTDVIADKFIDMNTVVLDDWTAVRFSSPVFLTSDREYAFVIKTDDANHSVSVAKIGDFDPVDQKFVGAQPYSVGVLLSSSNASTWTPHQDEDLTMRIQAADFNPITKTVVLGTFAVTQATDLSVRGVFQLPTEDARGFFEMELDDGTVYRVTSHQNVELDEFYTGDVIVRAVLEGSTTISPVLFPGVLLVVGKIRTSGTYISSAFDMGANIRLSTYFKMLQPSGSTVTIEIDAADDNWINVPETAQSPLNDGFSAREHTDTDHTAQPQGRIRVTLTGGPDARPSLADLRAVSI